MSNDKGFETLSIFTQLEKESRQAKSIKELMFVLSNRTRRLIPYDQAIVWSTKIGGHIKVRSVSATSNINYDAPYIVWLTKLLTYLAYQHKDNQEIFVVNPNELPDQFSTVWKEWLPESVLYCPIINAKGVFLGGMLLLRRDPWQAFEHKILEQLMEAYAHAWFSERYAKHKIKKKRPIKKLLIVKIIIIAFVACLFIPVQQSVLAQAEITPLDPSVISSSIDGVIHNILVDPNSMVEEGQVLFTLDDEKIKNDYMIAKKSYAVALEKFRKGSQHAFSDHQAKSQVAILKLEMEKARSNVSYNQSLLKRVSINSPRNGVVVYSAKSDWIGKPIKTGEKIMLVANPRLKDLTIWLPVTDAITLRRGAKIRLFLNTDPLNPIPARLQYASYSASERPDQTLAYQLRAKFPSNVRVPRLGLKGTAKIYGKKVSLFYYLFWRPLSAMRQALGF